MKINWRYGVVLVLVAIVLVLAQSGTAWATPDTDQQPAGQSAGSPVIDAKKGGGGTVKPPKNHLVITEPGTYSVGGCIIHVEKLDPGDAITVNYISRWHNDNKLEDKHPHFLAGTCQITQTEDGKIVDEASPEHVTASVCFATPQSQQGIVHEYNKHTKTWTELPTTYQVYDPATGTWRLAEPGEPALTCGPANLSGYYLASSE